MNNLAFQIYGTKKAAPFQSTWDTRSGITVSTTEEAARQATTPLTNWSLAGINLNVGGYTHIAGNTASLLVNSLGASQAQSYRIICTISPGAIGSVKINFGGVSSDSISATTTITLTSITTGSLSITPTSEFNGTVSLSIKASSSAANQIHLPISIVSGKSLWVDWGDNSYSDINLNNAIRNRLHTYSTPGEYTVRIFGDDFIFRFGFTSTINDRLKLKSISNWGKLKISANSFNSCFNVNMSGITDIPDLIGITSLDSVFYLCSEITAIGRINEWNTSLVTRTSQLFRGCTKFNSNISNWDVSQVTDMRAMFQQASVFNQNIGSWDVRKVTDMSEMFLSATAFNNGFASGDGVGNQLSWTINTASTVNMTTMFSNANAFNSNLGIGTTPWDVSKVTNFTNMFAPTSKFNNGDEADVTKSKINDWNIGGSATSVNMTTMFSNANAFNRPIDNWNMTKVNNTSGMFSYTNTFNQPLSNWERSGSTMANITNMSSMFAGNTVKFNQDISNWNVSGVTNFSSMFFATTLFNNGNDTNTNLITGRIGIDGWNINTASTASVNMSAMFAGGGGNSYVIFDRPIGNWNTSKVNNMSNMFGKSGNGNHAFNQYIGDWDTSSVTDMSNMFKAGQGDGTRSQFNQDISKWNVGKVTTFESMFKAASASASAFNNNLNENTNLITGRIGIDGWNINTASTASVNMASMFDTTRFNQYIGSWDVSRVNNMSLMFGYNNQFNQDISKWNVSGVTSFSQMFQNATVFNNGLNENTNPVTNRTGINGWNINTTATSVGMGNMFSVAQRFNRNINDWNTSKVTNMRAMFSGANDFNQPLSGWNVSKVTDMSYMFQQTYAFNQPLSNWERVSSPDTSTLANVTTMLYMFSDTAFNNPIGNWNISGVTNFTNFMPYKTALTFSYLDNLYNGWSSLPSVKPNISISFGGARYTSAGVLGRNTLTLAPNNWTIADGGNTDPILNLDAGNIASYPGTGTTWTDLSVNGNNGTLVNNPTFDPANGGSIVFDGVNQYMTTLLNNSANNTTSIIWYKWDGVNQSSVLTYLGNSASTGLGFLINNGTNTNTAGNKISVLYGGSYFNALNTGTLFGTLVSGVYTQLTLTRDGLTTTLYQNGVILGSTTRTPNASTSNLNFKLGAVVVDFPIFSGTVPLIQFYNMALTSTEVLANYNATKGRFGL
jgi:surface protein